MVLERSSGRTKREVVEVAAELWPQADVPSSVRRLPERSTAAAREPAMVVPAPISVSVATPMPTAEAPVAAPLAARPAPAPVRPVVAPLSPARYRVQFTADQATHDALRQLQDLLRREIPDGDPAAIVGRALAMLLKDTLRRKFAITSRPRKHAPC